MPINAPCKQGAAALLCRTAAPQFMPKYDGPRLVKDRQPTLDLAIDTIWALNPDPVKVARRPRPAVAQAAQGMQETAIDTRIYTLASVRCWIIQTKSSRRPNPSVLWQS